MRTDATLFPVGVPVKQELTVLPEDLVRVLFIAGRAPYDWAKQGRSSTYEWCHRVAVLPAYLSWSDDPVRRITRTALAHELDPSEKSMLSYTLGQAHQEPLMLGDYVVASFTALDVTLGVLAPVLQRVHRAARRNETDGLRDDVLRLLARHRPRLERTLYGDGTLFAADWTGLENRQRPGRQDSGVLPDSLHEAFRSMSQEEDWRAERVEEGDLNLRNLPAVRGYVPGIFPRSELFEG
ncbi:hypothetical protein ACF052_33095 [Streptomyces pilosus]|uniref:hypothetical protein n=1 Tax=Streptomyces pilosus TaxID=28893 RepID=UPI0037015879